MRLDVAVYMRDTHASKLIFRMLANQLVPLGEAAAGQPLTPDGTVLQQWPGGLPITLDVHGHFVQRKRVGRLAVSETVNPHATATIDMLFDRGFAVSVWSCGMTTGELVKHFGADKEFTFVWGGDKCDDLSPQRVADSHPLVLKRTATIEAAHREKLAGRVPIVVEDDWTKCAENPSLTCIVLPAFEISAKDPSCAEQARKHAAEAQAVYNLLDGLADVHAADPEDVAVYLERFSTGNDEYIEQIKNSATVLPYVLDTAFPPTRPLQPNVHRSDDVAWRIVCRQNRCAVSAEDLGQGSEMNFEEADVDQGLHEGEGRAVAAVTILAAAISAGDVELDKGKRGKKREGLAEVALEQAIKPLLESGMVDPRHSNGLKLQSARVTEVLAELQSAKVATNVFACTWPSAESDVEVRTVQVALTTEGLRGPIVALLSYHSTGVCLVGNQPDSPKLGAMLICATGSGLLWGIQVVPDGAAVDVTVARFGIASMSVDSAAATAVMWFKSGDEPAANRQRGSGVGSNIELMLLTTFPSRHHCGHGPQRLRQLVATGASDLAANVLDGTTDESAPATIALRQSFADVKATHAGQPKQVLERIDTRESQHCTHNPQYHIPSIT